MAELAGLPIPTMDWHSPDAPQAFKKFKARCKLYFSDPLKEKSEEEQISYLLIWSGANGIELVSTWALSAAEKKKHDTYWTCFENYLSPKSNFRLSRYKLKLLGKDATVTFDTALDIARTEEVTSNQIKEISPGTSTNVDALNCDPPIRPCGPIIRLCGRCGTEHNISE